jgi:hypothetical protein
MAKNRMGKGSFHAQDAQLNQNLPEIEDALDTQPTRPFVHRQQATKSSKDGLRRK